MEDKNPIEKRSVSPGKKKAKKNPDSKKIMEKIPKYPKLFIKNSGLKKFTGNILT